MSKRRSHIQAFAKRIKQNRAWGEVFKTSRSTRPHRGFYVQRMRRQRMEAKRMEVKTPVLTDERKEYAEASVRSYRIELVCFGFAHKIC